MMEEDVSGFPTRVTLGDDGAYRWTYDVRANGNSEPFRFMVRMCLAVSLPIALIQFILIQRFGLLQALLSVLLFLALIVGLPALIWALAPVNPSFKLTEDAVETWPRGKGVNVHPFKGARRVTVERRVDRIALRWRLGGLHVYVPREDFEAVRDIILARVPADAEILYD